MRYRLGWAGPAILAITVVSQPAPTSQVAQPQPTAGTAGPPLATKNMPPIAGQQKTCAGPREKTFDIDVIETTGVDLGMGIHVRCVGLQRPHSRADHRSVSGRHGHAQRAQQGDDLARARHARLQDRRAQVRPHPPRHDADHQEDGGDARCVHVSLLGRAGDRPAHQERHSRGDDRVSTRRAAPAGARDRRGRGRRLRHARCARTHSRHRSGEDREERPALLDVQRAARQRGRAGEPWRPRPHVLRECGPVDLGRPRHRQCARSRMPGTPPDTRRANVSGSPRAPARSWSSTFRRPVCFRSSTTTSWHSCRSVWRWRFATDRVAGASH